MSRNLAIVFLILFVLVGGDQSTPYLNDAGDSSHLHAWADYRCKEVREDYYAAIDSRPVLVQHPVGAREEIPEDQKTFPADNTPSPHKRGPPEHCCGIVSPA